MFSFNGIGNGFVLREKRKKEKKTMVSFNDGNPMRCSMKQYLTRDLNSHKINARLIMKTSIDNGELLLQELSHEEM